jgi:hypothetical protein
MSILLIESCEKKINKNFSNTSIVHVRNSIILQRILNCDLISHESEIDSIINNKYDIIICMYASPYMRYNKYLEILDNNKSARLYWLVNDHDCEDNILLRNWVIKYNKCYGVICNNPREGYRHWILGKKLNGKKLNDWIDEWITVDLNCLIFNELKRDAKDTLFTKGKTDCIYFGTFRKHRIDDMLLYNNCDYVISTSSKNVNKFKNSGIDARFIDRLNWEIGSETLTNFKFSIYFEDVHTHTNYAYMANRFYECVMCGVLMFFDTRCMMVIKKSGYNIDPFLICKDGFELQKKINELNNDESFYKSLLELQNENIYLINKNKEDVIGLIKEKLLTQLSFI